MLRRMHELLFMDRLDPNFKTVAQALLEGGIYKSQFETLLSSGSVSAHPGGARDIWEKKLFGGAYHRNDSDITQRPKYGSLRINHLRIVFHFHIEKYLTII